MNPGGHVVIIGGGQAGGELAAALRGTGFDGEISLVRAEPSYPYSRPPLSKAYLLGETDARTLLLRDAAMYAREGIEVLRERSAVAVDRGSRQVELDDGSRLRREAGGSADSSRGVDVTSCERAVRSLAFQ